MFVGMMIEFCFQMFGRAIYEYALPEVGDWYETFEYVPPVKVMPTKRHAKRHAKMAKVA